MSSKKPHMTKSQKAKPAKTTAQGKKVAIRKGAIKQKQPKPRKPKLPTFNCFQCEGQYTDRKQGGWHGPEGGLKWHCTDCLPRTRQPKRDKDGIAWFVLQCEPGTDSRVRKDILRTRRIEWLEDRIVKVMIATHLKEVITEEKGEKVAEGWELEVEPAKTAAIRKARELAEMNDGEVGPDGASAVPGYRWNVSRNHDVSKGYGWNWSVRKNPENPKAVRKVVKCKKFPGYIFVQCKWDAYIDKVIAKVRGAWGFLLRPVINNAHVQVVKFKNGKFGWKLRHPETRDVIDQYPPKRKTRYGYATKGDAAHAGGKVREEYESFHPVAVKTREAAELVLEQRAINQVVKDKEELNRVTYRPKVGDVVTIKNRNHPFANVECKVKEFDQKAGTVVLTAEVMGVVCPLAPLEVWEAELIRRPKTESK